MGISSDGLLVFGFPVGDGEEPPEWLQFDPLSEDGELEIMDFDDFICDTDELVDEEYDVRQKAIESCPADMTLYCSYDCPMRILAVRGTEIRVYRGWTKEITSLDVAPEKIAAFKAWCEEKNIEWQEPKWYLASMYG